MDQIPLQKEEAQLQDGQFWVITNPVCWSVLGYHNYYTEQVVKKCFGQQAV